MKKPKIIRDAERQFLACIVGLAIPCQKKTVEGGFILSEKVLKFNRTALKDICKSKNKTVDPRLVGGCDLMRFKVGKPGSKERIEALALQYASLAEDEMSPFMGE
jgi:hypothetical protein